MVAIQNLHIIFPCRFFHFPGCLLCGKDVLSRFCICKNTETLSFRVCVWEGMHPFSDTDDSRGDEAKIRLQSRRDRHAAYSCNSAFFAQKNQAKCSAHKKGACCELVYVGVPYREKHRNVINTSAFYPYTPLHKVHTSTSHTVFVVPDFSAQKSMSDGTYIRMKHCSIYLS